MEENRFMRVQPVTKGQPTFTNSNPRPLFKGQLSNKNNVSKTEEKEFQQVLKEVEDYDNKNKETNTGFKGTKRNEISQMSNVLTPLKPQHKLEDPYPYPNPKSTTPGKLNFIA